MKLSSELIENFAVGELKDLEGYTIDSFDSFPEVSSRQVQVFPKAINLLKTSDSAKVISEATAPFIDLEEDNDWTVYSERITNYPLLGDELIEVEIHPVVELKKADEISPDAVSFKFDLNFSLSAALGQIEEFSYSELAILPIEQTPFPTYNIYVDGILWGGNRWDVGSNRVIEYSFWGEGSESFDDFIPGMPPQGICTNAYDWLAQEMVAVEAAFQSWSNVANISFVRVADNDPNATIRLYSVNCAQIDGALGMCGPPDPDIPFAGIAYLGWDWDGWLYGLQPGGGGFSTIIHELGHGLGLAHPHDNGGGSPVYPGVTPGDYMDTGQYGLNQGIWTTMSYNEGLVSNDLNALSSFGLQATPMAFDVAAIQYLYGVNTSFHTGNDTYLLPTSNSLGTFYSCIWDAGGKDTISAGSTSADVTINLNYAPLIGANAGGFISSVDGVCGGFTLANGAIIENAIGGQGNDSLIGNSRSNTLRGKAGEDTLIGGGGKDKLIGGGGDDVLNGGSGKDRLIGNRGNDIFVGGRGKDILTGGGGHDFFCFVSLKDRGDKIKDFRPGWDKIVILADAFGGEFIEDQVIDSSQFVLGNSATQASHRFIYNDDTNRLFFDPDGIGGQKQILLATFSGAPTLTYSDIFAV